LHVKEVPSIQLAAFGIYGLQFSNQLFVVSTC